MRAEASGAPHSPCNLLEWEALPRAFLPPSPTLSRRDPQRGIPEDDRSPGNMQRYPEDSPPLWPEEETKVQREERLMWVLQPKSRKIPGLLPHILCLEDIFKSPQAPHTGGHPGCGGGVVEAPERRKMHPSDRVFPQECHRPKNKMLGCPRHTAGPDGTGVCWRCPKVAHRTAPLCRGPRKRI